jgi:hypothetical protein
MDDLLRKYLQLITQMVDLQKELISAFEKTVDIKPITALTDPMIKESYADIDTDHSENLKKLRDSWPGDWPDGWAVPMIVGRQSRQGVA